MYIMHKKGLCRKRYCKTVKLEFFFFFLMCGLFPLVHYVSVVHLCEVYNRAHLINTFVVIALEIDS